MNVRLLNTKQDGCYPSEFTGNYHVHTIVRRGEMTFSDGRHTFTSHADDLVIWQMTTAISNVSYSEDFDRYLKPYNTLDYLNSNSLTVSVRNKILKNVFKDDALWLELGEKEELIEVMNKALSMSEKEKNEYVKKANADANKLYSMSVVNRKLILFLKQFIKQRE